MSREELSKSEKTSLHISDKENSENAPDILSIVANLTHELKTPLHSILSVSSLLSAEVDGSLNEEQKRQVSIIKRNGEHLLELINNLLTFSSSNSKSNYRKISKINPRTILENFSEDISAVATSNKIKISTDFDKCPVLFYSDESLIYRIISNITGNALKFTPSGGEIYLLAEEKKNGELYIQISDTGIGMTHSMKEKLFSAFYQEDSSNTKNYGGVGLGLALVKSAIDKLEGNISVQTEKGKGSIFSITIPDLKDMMPVKNILIADQDKSTIKSLELLLNREGLKTYSCETSDLKESIMKLNPDLILMDMKSLDNESIDVLRNLNNNSNAPVIGMTTSINPSGRSHAFKAGISDIISKPFEAEELIARIKRHLKDDI